MSETPPSSSRPKPVSLAIRGNARVVVPIVHEDAEFLVIDKPAGMVTQPGKGHTSDSLLNGLFALRGGAMGKLLHNLGERRDYGLLHRLDKETSGLLVVAKSPNAYDQLRRDFEARQVDKEYWAITAGVPAPVQGVVQARLKEVQVANPSGYGTLKKVVISRQGQEAVSAYKVISQNAGKEGDRPAALVHVKIKTGRLHQIRAHMLFLNCQVLGDDIYAVPAPGFDLKEYPHAPRLCLHAGRLGFKHPGGAGKAAGADGKWVHFESAMPRDLTAFAGKLGLTIA